MNFLRAVFYLIPVGLLAVACGGQTPTPAEDSSTASTAIAIAVQATLTAEAQDGAAVTPADAAPTTAPTSTPSPAPSATPSLPPSATPSPTSALLPTNTATPEPEAPTPTPTRPLFAVVPVDGGRAELDGQIILPGVSQEQVTDPVIFHDKLVFRVEAYDPAVDTTDGAGIDTVKITLEREDDGQTVYEKIENQPGYCVFGGGEPDCAVFVFADNYNRWPLSNEPIFDGPYRAFIFITTAGGLTEQWNWGFRIEGVAAQAPETEGADITMQLLQVGPGETVPTVDRALVFQVAAYHTGYGNRDGDGISHVDMRILPAGGGNALYERTEQNAGYCAFGGGEPHCTVWNFAERGYAWPSGEPVQPGRYILQAMAYAVDGASAELSTEIDIEW